MNMDHERIMQLEILNCAEIEIILSVITHTIAPVNLLSSPFDHI